MIAWQNANTTPHAILLTNRTGPPLVRPVIATGTKGPIHWAWDGGEKLLWWPDPELDAATGAFRQAPDGTVGYFSPMSDMPEVSDQREASANWAAGRKAMDTEDFQEWLAGEIGILGT